MLVNLTSVLNAHVHVVLEAEIYAAGLRSRQPSVVALHTIIQPCMEAFFLAG